MLSRFTGVEKLNTRAIHNTCMRTNNLLIQLNLILETAQCAHITELYQTMIIIAILESFSLSLTTLLVWVIVVHFNHNKSWISCTSQWIGYIVRVYEVLYIINEYYNFGKCCGDDYACVCACKCVWVCAWVCVCVCACDVNCVCACVGACVHAILCKWHCVCLLYVCDNFPRIYSLFLQQPILQLVNLVGTPTQTLQSYHHKEHYCQLQSHWRNYTSRSACGEHTETHWEWSLENTGHSGKNADQFIITESVYMML